jgi:glycosyltransferase involved in cell wall biosynthesis
VRSFAALNPSVRRKLVLAGSTSDALYVSSVRKLASDLGVSQELEWRGVLTDKELRAEFARAQMLVLPSHQETAPMVIAQAMASCIPVVATRICGIPYQVRDGESGLLFRPGDTATLTMHMQRLLEERMQALTMGIVGRQIALERFHVTRVADATISAYRDTIAQSQCSQ